MANSVIDKTAQIGSDTKYGNFCVFGLKYSQNSVKVFNSDFGEMDFRVLEKGVNSGVKSAYLNV